MTAKKAGGTREDAGRKSTKPRNVVAELVQMSEGGQEYLDALHEIATEDAEATPAQRLKALELLLNYLWGRPSTQQPAEPAKLDVTLRLHYTDEELDAAIEASDE